MVDVRDAADVAAVVAATVQRHGRLDLMVNNAGINLSVDQVVTASCVDAAASLRTHRGSLLQTTVASDRWAPCTTGGSTGCRTCPAVAATTFAPCRRSMPYSAAIRR
jgi:NAD(P)-dependent dehydrogenase (short-subunit alcohol dehydrogenase family)